MSVRAPVGPVNLSPIECCIGRGLAAIRPKDESAVSFMYIFHVLRVLEDKICGNAGAVFASINKKEIAEILIPLPPLAVQQEIVAEIEGYQKVIDGARQVVENYKPRIQISPKWPMVELGEVCDIGGTIVKSVDGALPYIGADSIEADTGHLLAVKTANEQGVSGPIFEFSGKRLLYSKIRPYLNKLSLVDFHGYCGSDMYPLLMNEEKALYEYLTWYMLSQKFNDDIKGFYERASIPKINRQQLFSVTIPLPDLETQSAIVAEIEAEQRLVGANRELITRFEAKVKGAIDRVWGEG